MLCASCTKPERGKFIRCLHALCLECLSAHVDSSGGIHCPTCHRKTEEKSGGAPPAAQWLPDCNVPSELEKDGEASECGASAVGDDAPKHGGNLDVTSRSSLFQQSGGANCALHRHLEYNEYCTTCECLLCPECRCKHPREHEEFVLSTHDAAEKIRKRIGSRMNADVTTQAKAQVATVGSSMDEADLLADKLSNEITTYCNALVDAVKKREASLLEQLDVVFQRKCKPLEEERARFCRVAAKGETISSLLSTTSSPVNFLKLSQWLEEAVSEQNESVPPEARLPVTGTMVFAVDEGDELLQKIESFGDVSLATLDPLQTAVTGEAASIVNEELVISITPKDSCGKTMRYTGEVRDNLRLAVTQPGEETADSLPLPTSDADRLSLSYKPSIGGVHLFAATFNGAHLRGSPLKVDILTSDAFQPDKCHPGLVLTNENRTLAHCGLKGRLSALGTRVYRKGSHVIPIRIDKLERNGNIHVGMTRGSDLPSDSYSHLSDIVVWRSLDSKAYSKMDNWTSGPTARNPMWKPGDSVMLRLGCEWNTLTATHHKGGHLLEAYVCNMARVQSGMRVFVTLTEPGQQITFL